MFYDKELDKTLRFGDVLKGYIITDTIMKRPMLYMTESFTADIDTNTPYNYTIEVALPKYVVVLTPCCEIDQGKIFIAPLEKILTSYFKNEYFMEDFTNINRKMHTKKSCSTEDWEKKSSEEKNLLVEQGNVYALLEKFIYGENELFPKYTLKGREIRYYMIDFKNAQKLNYHAIQKSILECKTKRSEKDEKSYLSLLGTKCLQLSVHTRKELRDKMSFYYGRPAPEDRILLG